MRNVRLFYKKMGNMKFISHLDMNRFMIKMVRMSKIPIWYSEGFNPHPYLTFALPLSLGFESDYDIIDFRLEQDNFSNEEVVKKLRPLMPNGIEIISCCDPVMKTSDIAFADFCIKFDQNVSDYHKELSDFFESENIFAEKKTKKGIKTIDLKDFLKSYSLNASDIVLTLSAGGSNNLNPKLLLDTFEKTTSIVLPSYSVLRRKLYSAEMNLFK